MEQENLNSNPKPCIGQESLKCCAVTCLILLSIFFFSILVTASERKHHEIELVSMGFAATVNNDSTSHYGHAPLLSARWDLFIYLPTDGVNHDMCVEGNIQASFLYNNVTLVTSYKQRYHRSRRSYQLLDLYAVASEEDLSGATGKNIMEAIKERNEMWFGSRLSITDCKEKKKIVPINFVCNETALRFEPSDSNQIKATSFVEDITCIFSR